MAQPLNIGLFIDNKLLRQTIETLLNDCPAIRVSQFTGQAVGGFVPDMLIIEDETNADTPLALARLQQTYATTTFVVISANHNPGNIVNIMKAGAAEFLLEPIDKTLLHKAVNDARDRLAASTVGQRGSIYSFINSKGGVGSTVLAVNTALALKRDANTRVALWDMNFQAGDSVVLLDVFPESTIVDICHGIQRLDAGMLKNAMVLHKSGLELLAAPAKPDEENEPISASHLTRVLSVIGTMYEHVVIDCPSMAVNYSTVEAFNASDKVFIVIDLSIPAVRNASRLYTLMRQVGINDYKIEFVVNRFAERGMLPIEEAEKNLHKQIYWLFPNNFAEVMTSINLGNPLILSNPGCNLSRSINAFVDKVKAPEQFQNTRALAKKGLLGGLFAK